MERIKQNSKNARTKVNRPLYIFLPTGFEAAVWIVLSSTFLVEHSYAAKLARLADHAYSSLANTLGGHIINIVALGAVWACLGAVIYVLLFESINVVENFEILARHRAQLKLLAEHAIVRFLVRTVLLIAILLYVLKVCAPAISGLINHRDSLGLIVRFAELVLILHGLTILARLFCCRQRLFNK